MENRKHRSSSSKPHAAQRSGDFEGTVLPPDDLDDLVASADALDALIAEEARRFDERIAERLREVERDCISDDEFDMMLDRLKRERPTTVRGRPGRPSKATEAVVAALCAALSGSIAARSTIGFRLGMRFPDALRAREGGPRQYTRENCGADLRARARGALYLILKSLSGGKGSHAARWMLERLFREDYGVVIGVENPRRARPPRRDIGGCHSVAVEGNHE
ncbi:MAG: hypothetical protein ACYDFS_05165 [Vulcanimicrobiaceae bacterium]